MWPMLLDMSRDECKRILRRLELEAYSSLVSAFRAQGDLNKEKKRILQDLQQNLSISTERHRAEVRRAINDEKLSTIADSMAGPNTESEWLIEGRRLIPLMPRLVPQTAFTVTANHAANIQAEKNASMPSPSHTGNKDVNTAASPTTPVGSGISKVSRPSSPSSNVVVLPSGMSIHIKGGLNTEEDEEPISRKRRRSQSTETIVSPSASTQTPRVTYTTTAASSVSGMSPMKITISKSPQGRSQVSTNITQSQKVILVSSSGQSPSVLQKSITVPVVKTVGSLAGSGGHSKASIILPNTSVSSSNGSLGNIVTVATPTMSTATSTCTTPTVVTTSTMTFLTPAVSVPKPRLKTSMPRQRFTTFTQAGQPKPGVVIPMGPQPVQPSPQNIQIKPVTKASAIQIRQEGGMKIITQSIPGSSTSKILPKPTQLSNSSGTPVVVVSAGSSTATSSVTMVTRPVTSIGQSGTKILNITQGGKVISGVNRSGNVVTVSPKTLHLTAVKSQSGGSGKPNVIVVQKTQPKKSQGGLGGTSKGTTIISSPFEKELVSFLQKQDSTKHIVVTTPGSQRTERKVIVTTPGQLEAVTRQRARSESEGKTTSLLADLIHAAGIVPDSTSEATGDVTINLDEAAMAALSVSSQDSDTSTQSTTSQSLPNNEWFEYDVTDDSSQNYQTSGLESGVEIQTSESTQAKPKVTVQRSASVDLSQLSDQLSPQQFYSIEQAMKILNQPNAEGTAPTLDPVSLLRMEGSESSHSDPGTSESQSSLTTDNAEVDTTTSIPSSQSSAEGSQSELEHLAPGLNFQGELDPQTGIFYTVAATSGSDTVVASTPTLDRAQLDATTPGTKTFDLLSSSLAQAQIDLDPYQFIEEDVLVEKADSQSDVPTDDQTTDIEATTTDSSEVTLGEVPSGGPIIHIKSSSFIPIQDLNKSRQNATINITRHQPLAQGVSELILPQEGVFAEGVEVMGQEGTLDDLESHMGGSLSDSMSSGVSSSAVTVETAQMVDPADVRAEMSSLDDLGVVTSPSMGNSSDSQEVAGLDLSASLRMSKRKRKAPSNIDETPNQVQGSWIRSCIGLIQRVSRYRGLNREKGDLNAASWFTEPVDRSEVPDYYTIIKHPMDFGTIRKKLEANTYLDQEDFHTDMLLVRDNCRTYNPPGSTVRRDCDEVFAFYMSEYEKLLDRWQKAQMSSPSPKKSRLEKSPVRP
ncbi:LOW QUALITY PROTEIN: BRCA2-interacting transcriptional repressor EMSY-like [Pecten maximus]|uniref:LOW QUALITY PROTEIN: BRCA2-interacting transcriptional repressor EMSY-like n=1 Tax=Pecten maximus TaxID=6579 RepID=UPI0014590A8B|nr:LOW QUALITY PROTEIN: BRCA2-interacting transcriptional repressor EMSY-like [Pecten maximus]